MHRPKTQSPGGPRHAKHNTNHRCPERDILHHRVLLPFLQSRFYSEEKRSLQGRRCSGTRHLPQTLRTGVHPQNPVRSPPISQDRAPDAMTELLRGALATGLKASYVLFDSWFSTPANILAPKELELDVIAMVKETSKVRPLYKEHLVPLSSDVSLSAEENRFIVLVTSLWISRCRKPSSSWWGVGGVCVGEAVSVGGRAECKARSLSDLPSGSLEEKAETVRSSDFLKRFGSAQRANVRTFHD